MWWRQSKGTKNNDGWLCNIIIGSEKQVSGFEFYNNYNEATTLVTRLIFSNTYTSENIQILLKKKTFFPTIIISQIISCSQKKKNDSNTFKCEFHTHWMAVLLPLQTSSCVMKLIDGAWHSCHRQPTMANSGVCVCVRAKSVVASGHKSINTQ